MLVKLQTPEYLIYAELSKTERITHLASKNRIPVQTCYAILHEIEAREDYEVTWGLAADDRTLCLHCLPPMKYLGKDIKQTDFSPKSIKILAAGNGDRSLKLEISLHTMKNSLRTNVSLTINSLNFHIKGGVNGYLIYA